MIIRPRLAGSANDQTGAGRELAIGLRDVGISLKGHHLAVLCRTIIESSERILDIAVQSPPNEAKLLVRELKLMITNLLSAYLD